MPMGRVMAGMISGMPNRSCGMLKKKPVYLNSTSKARQKPAHTQVAESAGRVFCPMRSMTRALV